MIETLCLDTEAVQGLGVSKLREIASLATEKDQVGLLEAASGMSVSDVQKEAKRLRDKAAGRETDPLEPVTLMLTSTQREFLEHCMREARRVYSIEDSVPNSAVLIDCVLADWHSNIDGIEAEAVEASQ
jgi:hypothetical protein